MTTDMKEAAKAFAHRWHHAEVEAYDNIVIWIKKEAKITKVEAKKVVAFYLKKKWIKFDFTNRSYNAKSGNILDKQFILDALELIKSK